MMFPTDHWQQLSLLSRALIHQCIFCDNSVPELTLLRAQRSLDLLMQLSSVKDRPAALGFCLLILLITVNPSSRKELGRTALLFCCLSPLPGPLQALQEMWPCPFGLSGCLTLEEVFVVKMSFLT